MANAVATWTAEVARAPTWVPRTSARVVPMPQGHSNSIRRPAIATNEQVVTADRRPKTTWNGFLAALPATDLERWSPYLEPAELRQGEFICEPGQSLRYAYFPTTSVISLQCFTQSGATMEVATVGVEGLVGVSLIMNADAVTGPAIVQVTGHAYRVPVHHLQRELTRGGSLAPLLLHHARALVTQSAQIAICNRHHTIEQQVCRWLLTGVDRAPSGRLSVTHDLLARALGVRREGVTRAVGRLQQAGLIRCRRGAVAVVDGMGLKGRSCECYGVIRSALHGLAASQRTRDACVAAACSV